MELGYRKSSWRLNGERITITRDNNFLGIRKNDAIMVGFDRIANYVTIYYDSGVNVRYKLTEI